MSEFSLDIVIPSRGRIKKLENCLNSLFISTKEIPINLYLYFSIPEELEYFKSTFNGIGEIRLKLLDSYRVPNFWNSHLKSMNSDAMLYANDDLLFMQDTIDLIIKKFEQLGSDIVLGLSQCNLPEDQACPGAFGVIGKEYIKRFPDSQVFCLDYFRFRADWELWTYAKEINRFHFDKNIKIQHLHPSFDHKLVDDTHKNVRKFLPMDNDTFRKRQENNWLWGRTFNLIHEQ